MTPSKFHQTFGYSKRFEACRVIRDSAQDSVSPALCGCSSECEVILPWEGLAGHHHRETSILVEFLDSPRDSVDVAPMRTLDDKPELSHMPLGAHETMHHGVCRAIGSSKFLRPKPQMTCVACPEPLVSPFPARSAWMILKAVEVAPTLVLRLAVTAEGQFMLGSDAIGS